MFALFYPLIISVLFLLSILLGESAAETVVGIFLLSIFMPHLALGARRLHDTGHSSWWLLLDIIPFGSIVLITFFIGKSEIGANKYGKNPYEIVPMPPPLPLV